MEIDELLESVDILDYISQYCDLEPKGGEYWGLSPLKEENTPSFSVNRDRQVFYDFSSRTGGTDINFIMAFEHCSYSDAVERLKKYAGAADGEHPSRLTSAAILRKYRRMEKKEKQAAGKILPPNYMERYERDLSKLQIWIDEGISADVLDRWQVRYDPVSNRLVFPLRNEQGQIFSVSGRTLDPDFKEKEIRKYTYFQNIGVLDAVCGLFEHRGSTLAAKEIILFEGVKSVMLVESWGIVNTGALLTSHLNHFQLKTLIRLGVRTVFALDKGIDIRQDKNIQKLRRFVSVEWVTDTHGLLEDKMAPVDQGKEVWLELYKRRRRL